MGCGDQGYGQLSGYEPNGQQTGVINGRIRGWVGAKEVMMTKLVIEIIAEG